MQLGKTIQIYLPDGNPRGMKIAEITSRTIQAVLVPRVRLADAIKRNELENVGIYFLIGNPDQKSKSSLYIGEAENSSIRLTQHNQQKEFWNVAIAIISKTQYFTKTHVKYLEWYCLAEAKEANRYTIENSALPKEPYAPENVQADLMDYFDTIKVLVSTLGYPIFDKITKPPKQDVLICKTKDVRAEGEYTDDGFVIFAGSECRLHTTKSASTWIKNSRKKLIEDKILVQSDNKYKFASNYIFSSPSGAAAVVLGYPANGWIAWKNEDGKTLEEINERQQPKETTTI